MSDIKKENKQMAKTLPEEMKNVLVTLCGATMEIWEGMPAEEKAVYGTPQAFLGDNIMRITALILEERLGLND